MKGGEKILKKSASKYCAECLKDFKSGEIVWYSWLENRSFCSKCKKKLNIKDWEKRVVQD